MLLLIFFVLINVEIVLNFVIGVITGPLWERFEKQDPIEYKKILGTKRTSRYEGGFYSIFRDWDMELRFAKSIIDKNNIGIVGAKRRKLFIIFFTIFKIVFFLLIATAIVIVIGILYIVLTS